MNGSALSSPVNVTTDRKTIITKRIAIILFFFVNGFLYATWTARLPELKAFFNITNGTLGTLLFTTAAGAVVAMPLAGWLTSRFHNEKTTVIAGLLFCCAIPLIPVSDNLWVARACFFATGFFSGAMDVAMNGQAVLVERSWKKPIMSSFHALWSIGMALGAGVSALFSRFEVPLTQHFLIMSILAVATIASCARIIIRNPLPAQSSTGAGHGFRLPAIVILPLGIIAFGGMSTEGAMADWTAIYMHTIVGSTESFSALTFGVFGTAMTIGRLFGDQLATRLGRKRLLLIDVALALIGLSICLTMPFTGTSIAGFFLIGLGLSTIVPIVYSAAGNVPGMNPAAGIAMASTIGYLGFFVGPPMIGYLSDHFGLRIAFIYLAGLLLLMAILISKLKFKH